MKGDHLKVYVIGIWHHGIDCGDGTAIHLSKLREKKIVRTSLADFAAGHPDAIRPGESPANFSPDEIVARAETYVGQEGYNLAIHNCEHFVNLVRCGTKHSRQVARAAHHVGRTGTKFVAGLTARGLARTTGEQIAKTGTRTLGRVAAHPALISSVALQLGTEYLGQVAGMDERTAERAGQAVGLGSSVGIGATIGSVGGPVGAMLGGVTGGAVWGISEAIGHVFGRLISAPPPTTPTPPPTPDANPGMDTADGAANTGV